MTTFLRTFFHSVLLISYLIFMNACSEDVELPDKIEIDADIIIAVQNFGSVAWRVASVTDPNGNSIDHVAGELNINNTTLTLQVDKRYYIKNPAGGSHPFEIIGGSEILLSQFTATNASFENDASVNFVPTEDGFIFTFTESLSEATDGYQCAVHSGPMSGLIIIEEADPNEPDVVITMINNGSAAWHVDTVVGATDIAAIHSNNTTITLTQGLRYEFRINAPGHPFQLIDANNILLVTGTSGSFHDDAAVNYIKSGSNFTFTLTEDLAAELAKYRCGVHTGAMIGNIVIE